MDEPRWVEWAKVEAERLRQSVPRFRERDSSAYADPTGIGRWSEVTPALEFLDRVAPGTAFALGARERAEKEHAEGGAVEAVAAQLENWIRFVEAGLASALPYETTSRIDAATDLMEQVQQLLGEPGVHPAAPVMLAGAALEEFLRSLASLHAAEVPSAPSLTKYAESLRAAGVLHANDVKDVVSLAGVRNDAAHGHFDKISVERAVLMADHVNFFIRQHQPGRE